MSLGWQICAQCLAGGREGDWLLFVGLNVNSRDCKRRGGCAGSGCCTRQALGVVLVYSAVVGEEDCLRGGVFLLYTFFVLIVIHDIGDLMNLLLGCDLLINDESFLIPARVCLRRLVWLGNKLPKERQFWM